MTLEEYWISPEGLQTVEIERRLLSRLLAQHQPANALLQVGGPITSIFPASFQTKTGIYASMGHLRHQTLNTISMDVYEWPLLPNSVDWVIVQHVFGTLQLPGLFLNELDQALQAEGHVLMVGFQFWSAATWRAFFGAQSLEWKQRHWFAWQLKRWLKQIGYVIQQYETESGSYALLAQKQTLARRWVGAEKEAWMKRSILSAEPAQSVRGD